MRGAGLVAHMGDDRKTYKVLVEKPKGKRPFARPKRRWADGISGRLAGEVVDWIQLAQDRNWWRAVVNVVMNLWVLAPWS
jgi:hypothetical protein